MKWRAERRICRALKPRGSEVLQPMPPQTWVPGEPCVHSTACWMMSGHLRERRCGLRVSRCLVPWSPWASAWGRGPSSPVSRPSDFGCRLFSPGASYGRCTRAAGRGRKHRYDGHRARGSCEHTPARWPRIFKMHDVQDPLAVNTMGQGHVLWAPRDPPCLPLFTLSTSPVSCNKQLQSPRHHTSLASIQHSSLCDKFQLCSFLSGKEWTSKTKSWLLPQSGLSTSPTCQHSAAQQFSIWETQPRFLGGPCTWGVLCPEPLLMSHCPWSPWPAMLPACAWNSTSPVLSVQVQMESAPTKETGKPYPCCSHCQWPSLSTREVLPCWQ